MLKCVRYKIANYFAKKALDQIESGEFEEIIKGLKNFKRSVMIVPRTKELRDLGVEWQEKITRYQKERGL